MFLVIAVVDVADAELAREAVDDSEEERRRVWRMESMAREEEEEVDRVVSLVRGNAYGLIGVSRDRWER